MLLDYWRLVTAPTPQQHKLLSSVLQEHGLLDLVIQLKWNFIRRPTVRQVQPSGCVLEMMDIQCFHLVDRLRFQQVPAHPLESNSNDWTRRSVSTGSQPYGDIIQYPNASPNGTSSQFLYCADSSAKRMEIRSNGGIANFSGNNANLCDEREKKNIVSLDEKWDKVKSWELKKFHYNEDADTDDLRYGVIAQQIETVCPEVLTDWEKQSSAEAVLDGDGNVVTPAKEQIIRKGVKEQQMMWMAIKALQEAQTRIETLETANADLVARVTALEG